MAKKILPSVITTLVILFIALLFAYPNIEKALKEKASYDYVDTKIDGLKDSISINFNMTCKKLDTVIFELKQMK